MGASNCPPPAAVPSLLPGFEEGEGNGAKEEGSVAGKNVGRFLEKSQLAPKATFLLS